MFFQLFFTAIKCIFLDLFTDRNDIFLCRFIFFNHRNHSFHSTRTLTEKRYPIRAEPPSTGHYKESPPPPPPPSLVCWLAYLALNLVDSKICLGLE